MHRGLLFIFFILVTNIAESQTPSRAPFYFNLAMRLEAAKEHEKARDLMEKAIKDNSQFAEAYSILGAWYFKDHRFEKASEIFGKAYRSLPRGAALFAFPLAKSLLYNGQINEALSLINSAPANNTEWEKLRSQALFVQHTLANAPEDTVFNMGPAINSADAEMFPWISADDKRIFFTRRRNRADEDFYTALKDTCNEWYTAKNMGSPPNTPHQEAAQMISADGHYLFFMKCENRSANGWAQGGCDLYMSYTSDSIWSVPQSFGATINTPAYEGMPCLSPDNRELYFVSDRAGGYGGMDIWVSKFKDGFWQVPRNLGSAINTPEDEVAPFIHIDNHTLYFSSKGHTGCGGSDLFMCRRINDSAWSKPVNLGMPINSSGDESSANVSTDGATIYFASDRDSLAGNFDIYTMKLPETLKPVPVNIVKGFVYDSFSKERLNYASVFIRDAYTGEDLYHFNSNRGDGSYTITLPAGSKYEVHTDRVSYKEGKDLIDLTEKDLREPYFYNISLLPSDYVAPIHDSLLLTIYFSKNSQKLSDSDKNELHKAMEPWLFDNQGLIFFINSYTDNSGTPLLNEELSYMRARLISKELQALGIDAMNIHTRGWGEANPVADNHTDEGKDLNRRVEVIIRR